MGGIQDFLSKFNMVQQALQGITGGGGTSTDELVDAICPKSPWDRFIEGVNRTIKPLLLASIILMFHWAAQNPESFTLFANAISALPDMAWYTIFTVVSSWVVIRSIGDYRRGGSNTVGTTVTTTVSMNGDSDDASLGRFGRDDQHHDLIQTMPIGNQAIADWKKKRR